VDKQDLIKKKLQIVNKGEAKPFKLLYQTIQDFTNDIIDVEVKLQQEVTATREYLKEKYQPAEVPKANPTKVGRVSITLDSSDEEREPRDFVRTMGVGPRAAEILEDRPEDNAGDQPDSGKQLVPFKLSEEAEEWATGAIRDFIPLSEEPASLQPPPGDLEAITKVGKAD
jgi:hypothetical protein